MITLAERARRLTAIDAAVDRANKFAQEQRAQLLATDVHASWLASGAEPNDRERELALRTMNAHNRGDCSTAVLMTSIAKALATYRVELGREAAE